MNAGAATDRGLVRGRNEDRFWIDAERGVFLVVDGVGGHAAGELAAEIAVSEIQESLSGAGASACQPEGPQSPAEGRVRAAITRANNRIFELAQEDPARRGMACVATLAVLEDGELTIGHVGDSRLYLVWRGAMRKLTSDHSPVGEEEEAGELSEREAMSDPRRNEVFRDVGLRPRTGAEEDFIEIRKCRFRPDAAILLCSDGLTDQLTSAQVREIIARYEGDAERVARELVAAAQTAGGKDNATALFVAGAEFGTRAGVTRLRLATTSIRVGRYRLLGRLAYLGYGLLIGMLVWAVLRVARG
jgi:serine/threonine protein phosphatase PrpC